MNSTGIHGFLQPPMLDLRDFTWISRILQILSKNPQNLPRPQLHVKREVGDVRPGPDVPNFTFDVKLGTGQILWIFAQNLKNPRNPRKISQV